MFTLPGADARAKRNARVLGAPGTSNRHRRGCEHCGATYQPIPGAVQATPNWSAAGSDPAMSEGAEHRPATLTSWLDAERAELEDRRSRIALQIEALAGVEAAVGRYRAICAGTPDAVREEGSRTDEASPAGTPVPDGLAARPGAPADSAGSLDGTGAPEGGNRRLSGVQDAAQAVDTAPPAGEDGPGATAPPASATPPPERRACAHCGEPVRADAARWARAALLHCGRAAGSGSRAPQGDGRGHAARSPPPGARPACHHRCGRKRRGNPGLPAP